MYKRILVAVDGSENSKRAAEHAEKIASTGKDGTVDVIYVLDYDRMRTDVIQSVGRDDLHNDRRKKLSRIEAVFEQKSISYELHIKHGEPGATIVNFANRGGFDLIIIGSRGLNTFQEMVLGSVSHKVAKRVHPPVMIVK